MPAAAALPPPGRKLHTKLGSALFVIKWCSHADQVAAVGFTGQYRVSTIGIGNSKVITVNTAHTTCPRPSFGNWKNRCPRSFVAGL